MKSAVVTTPKGLLTALVAFLIWGNFPLYFKELSEYNALEIIVHRVVWTFVVLSLVLLLAKRGSWLSVIKQNPKWLALTFLAAILIGINWLTYVWAVTHDRILEASLGYFIHPLFNVALSMLLFKEKLRPLQVVAVALAVVAVLIQIFWFGGLSWVSLLLPLSFGFYGVIQRQTPFDAIDGLFIETLLLLPFCGLWLMTADVVSSDLGFWLSSDIWLLTLAGPITLIPLLLYNMSTKQVAFNVLAFLNYLTPSIVFLLAVFYYGEAFDVQKLLVFCLIWLGLVIFSADMLHAQRKTNE